MIYVLLVRDRIGWQAVRTVYDDGPTGQHTYADAMGRFRSLQRLYGGANVVMIPHRERSDGPTLTDAEAAERRIEYERGRRSRREIAPIVKVTEGLPLLLADDEEAIGEA